jgi:serine/threonine-protein kinase
VRLAPNVDAASGGAAPFAGTAAYLPPEAYEGRPATQAFDLWALSVIMVQAITGLDPVRAQRPENLSGSGCPPDLIAFLDRALARDPNLRFSTSVEFLSALEGFL